MLLMRWTILRPGIEVSLCVFGSNERRRRFCACVDLHFQRVCSHNLNSANLTSKLCPFYSSFYLPTPLQLPPSQPDRRLATKRTTARRRSHQTTRKTLREFVHCRRHRHPGGRIHQLVPVRRKRAGRRILQLQRIPVEQTVIPANPGYLRPTSRTRRTNVSIPIATWRRHDVTPMKLTNRSRFAS